MSRAVHTTRLPVQTSGSQALRYKWTTTLRSVVGENENQMRDMLFQAEFGQYFTSVSPENPIGVCSKCLTLRDRNEVDPQEKCPADLLQSGLSDVGAAQLHDWVGFTEAEPLQDFVQKNITRFRQIVEQAAQVVALEPEDEQELDSNR